MPAPPADLGSSSDTSLTVYDSLGASHVLTLVSEDAAPISWSYKVSMPGDEVAADGGSALSIPGASGTLTSTADGQLTDPGRGRADRVRHPGPEQRRGRYAHQLGPLQRRGRRAAHAIRAAYCAFGQLAERIGGGATGPRRPGRRRQDPGAIPTATR